MDTAAMELDDKQGDTDLDTTEVTGTGNHDADNTHTGYAADTDNHEADDADNHEADDADNHEADDTDDTDNHEADDTDDADNHEADDTDDADNHEADDTDDADDADNHEADNTDTDTSNAAVWDTDLPSSDNVSDFIMSSQVLSEDDPSDIEASDFEVDPVPEGMPDKGWDFSVNAKKFKNGPHLPFNSELEFRVMSLFSAVGSAKFSRDQQLGVLKAYEHVPDSPTLGRLRSLSADLRALLNVSPNLYKIGDKPVYYIPIQQTIRLAFANPVIRNQLHTLPTLQKISSELYHSSKWFEEIPTPMVRVERVNGFYDIFAGEAYHLGQDEVSCIVPVTFATTEDGSVIACGKKAMVANRCLIVKDEDIVVAVSSIPSAVDIQALRSFWFGQTIPVSLARTVKAHSPLRAKAKGRRVINLPLTLFNDDTSGNVSKKWNKYESWLFSLTGLPFKATQQQSNINFICTSKKASAIETAEIIVHCMRELQDGIVVYDVTLEEDVVVIGELVLLSMHSSMDSLLMEIFKGCILQILGDNPAQSIIVSHSGLASSKPCRICDVQTPSSANLLPMFLLRQETTILRSFTVLKEKLMNWSQLVMQKELPPATVSLQMKLAGIKDYHFNKFLDDHFSRPAMNPLLGANLKAYLEGVQQEGLPERIDGHSLVHYVGSLVGKDFRLFVQIAPFALTNVVTKELLATWVSLSHLVAHLYMSHIHVALYNVDFTNHMDQFVFHASKTPHFYEVVKPKLHLLRHIPDLTRRFGPPRLCATEAFESSNKIIRNCISHTSRQNTLRDVSMHFANNMAVQHVVDGGAFQIEHVFRCNNSLQHMSTRTEKSSRKSVVKLNQFVQVNESQSILLQVTSIDTSQNTATGLEFGFSVTLLSSMFSIAALPIAQLQKNGAQKLKAIHFMSHMLEMEHSASICIISAHEKLFQALLYQDQVKLPKKILKMRSFRHLWNQRNEVGHLQNNRRSVVLSSTCWMVSG
ncbi:hypothetical protein CcCBS67573_g10386 [Chytriomyces confervae]|uniref:Uncharacterized protein n=1 Tax=Chytriomyces confervae TaxID=246404 RepID=A0A507D0G1_9FUNG|nr:hypothetical protein CcCBS67573_g10386 [Chytriomyces confervae]